MPAPNEPPITTVNLGTTEQALLRSSIDLVVPSTRFLSTIDQIAPATPQLIYSNVSNLYQELLTVGRDANEMYLFPAPEGLVGKDFVELTGMFARYRGDRRSCLLIGIQRGEEMHLNPIGGEAGPLRPDDQLILLSRVFLDPSQPLPTDPPITAPPETG